jgi:two-component system, cell cycle response regulator
VQCTEGFDPYEASRIEAVSVPPGYGLLGTVASTGVADRGRMGEVLPELALGEPRCGTYLAVPLRVPPADGVAVPAQPHGEMIPTVHGVLALYDRAGDDEFDDTDLRTVRTFAGHAAIAVHNVRLHDEARRLSHTDPLTGLYNVRHLRELLGREVNRSVRFGHPLCVMALDLDRFKGVNDAYGHAAGDAVLQEFARRLGTQIRGVDLAFRTGGEEFVLLLPETDGLGGITLARRLGAVIRDTPMTVPVALRAVAGPPVFDPRFLDLTVTVSIGVAVFPEHGADGPTVWAAADEALYAAKSAGRNTYRLAVGPATAPRTVAQVATGLLSGASSGAQPPSRARGR